MNKKIIFSFLICLFFVISCNKELKNSMGSVILRDE